MMDEIKSIKGVGSVQEFGADFAMRVWLDPSKMAQHNVTIAQVTSAISAQNRQAAAGSLGTDPTPSTQQINRNISIQGRLITPQEFGNIVIKTDSNGNLLRLKDVATIQLGSEDYGF